MYVLVTGAAGFLGSHLVRRLLADGHAVHAIDNFQTGSAANLPRGEAAIRMSCDTLNVRDVAVTIHGRATLMSGPRFDRIYHLACPASPPHYQRDPIDTLLTAFEGTHAVLRLAEAHGARVFIASTSEIYGDPEISPQVETYWGNVNPTGIRACYDEGKRAAEALAADFGRHRGADVRVARIFNTYGPRMALDDGRAVSNFIVQALKGKALTLYGDGHQTRSFCYVDDLIEGIVRLTEHPENIGPTNLGNPLEISLRELALTVNRVARGGESAMCRLEYKPLPGDDPKRRRPDITKARTLLGWEPRVDLFEGLEKTIADFKERLAAHKEHAA